MEPVTQVSGDAYPWGAKNVDTDVIIPAHWLKTITRAGLGKGAFETVRAEPGNIFDDPRHAGSPILFAGDNLGCGSRRKEERRVGKEGVSTGRSRWVPET